MANEKKDETKPGNGEQPPVNPTPPTPDEKAEAKPDLVTEIGTLTYPRAVTAFGKDKALDVMHKVAAIGGHGLFEDADFLSPLFGGLAMPSPDKVIKPVKENFAHLPEAEFYYQAALEEYSDLQDKAASSRVAINELYNSMK